MLIAQVTGLAFALGSAVLWGGADFAGGLASRRSHFLEVLAMSRLSGLVVLCVAAVVSREGLPTVGSAGWAAAAGATGALGIGVLYRGLATERATLVVPTAGVVGAAIPVLVEAILHGVLPLLEQAGLVIALAGIFLVSAGHGPSGAGASRGVITGVVAGIGFGGFFLLLGQVEPGAVFTPLVAASCAGLAVALVALVISRAGLRAPARNPTALAAGMLDATGVVFYLLAVRWIRLDIAAVLASLYPAITVLLFRAVLREFVSRTQWLGLSVCVAAIALIAV